MLIITGTMGSGKSSILAEASDILSLRQVSHAAIDLDALGLAYLASGADNDRVMYQNLQSVCRNYAALAVKRLLLARAMETRAELELCQSIVSPASTRVCRLRASIGTMEHRIRLRESGLLQADYIARVAKLNFILDGARLEDFIVTNENRPVSEVAQEMLVKAGWIPK